MFGGFGGISPKLGTGSSANVRAHVQASPRNGVLGAYSYDSSFIPGRSAMRPAGLRCPYGKKPIIRNGVTIGCTP